MSEHCDSVRSLMAHSLFSASNSLILASYALIFSSISRVRASYAFLAFNRLLRFLHVLTET